MEEAVIHVKVKYDAGSRTLRLVVPAFEALLDPDTTYDLSVQVPMHDETEIMDLIVSEPAVIAHA